MLKPTERVVVSGKGHGGENPQELRKQQVCRGTQFPGVEDALTAFRYFVPYQLLGFETAFDAKLESLCTMEDVLVGIGKTAFDAQVTIGVGAFTLQGKGMPVTLLHGDSAIETVEAVALDIYRVELDVHVVE